MKILITSSTLVGGVWHEPGTGNYDPALGQHLIDIGSAVRLETKINPPQEIKKKVEIKRGSSSDLGQALTKKTQKKRKNTTA
jgi:hypothetical protein